MFPPSARILAALAAAASLAAPAAAAAAPGDTTIVSRADGPAGALPLFGAFDPAIDADGSVAGFVSTDDVEPLSGLGTADVYTRNVAPATTHIESVVQPIAWLAPVAGDAASRRPVLSGSARYVAFESAATNFSNADDDGATDVFVRDRSTGAVELISRASGLNGAGGDADSRRPSISADGRYVAFESDATNLSGHDDDGVTDVFVRDRRKHVTWLVSRRGRAGGDGASTLPQISGDGSRVAYRSEAANLSDDDVDGVADIFIGTRSGNQTELVSQSTGGVAQDADAGAAPGLAIDEDGSRVAFVSGATNLAGGGAHVDLFLRDRAAGTTSLLVSGDDDIRRPSMSASGQSVAFDSAATNLPDADGQTQVYVHRVASGATSLQSRNSAGAVGSGLDARISANGKAIAFATQSAVIIGGLWYQVVALRELPGPGAPGGGITT